MTCATHKKRNERFFSPHVEEQHNYGLEGICQVRFIKKTHNLQPESIQFLISLCLVEIYHPSSPLLILLIFPCRLNTRLFNKQKPTTQKRHHIVWNALAIVHVHGIIRFLVPNFTLGSAQTLRNITKYASWKNQSNYWMTWHQHTFFATVESCSLIFIPISFELRIVIAIHQNWCFNNFSVPTLNFNCQILCSMQAFQNLTPISGTCV